MLGSDEAMKSARNIGRFIPLLKIGTRNASHPLLTQGGTVLLLNFFDS